MSMQDPVADLLTRIRNGQMIGLKDISVPHSKLKESMLVVLKDEGFINDFGVTSEGCKKNISVTLKYYHGQPVIQHITRISRPALRVYRQSSKLPLVRGGLGIAIISTPKGVMSDKSARAQHVGGEVLCTVE